MIARIDTLTTAQAAQLDAHVDRWIEAALRTGPINRRAFTKAVRRCQELAGAAWHGNVVWVDSPLVLALAAPLAAFLIPWHRHGLPEAAVNGSVGAAIGAGVRAAANSLAGVAEGAVRGRVQTAINAVLEGAAGVPARPAVRLTTQAVQAAVADLLAPFDLTEAPLGRMADRVGGAALRSTLRGVREVLNGATAGTFRDVREATAMAVRAGSAAAWSMHDALAGVRVGPVIERCLYQPEVPFEGMNLAPLAFMSFLCEVCGLELPAELQERLLACGQAVQSGGWWLAHPEFLMVCERPLAIHRERTDPARPRGESSHRLHRSDGPAMGWAAGWGVYVVRGRRVPGWIIEDPGRLHVAAIEAERNAEVRRVMMERYGLARYMRDSGAQVVDGCGPDHPVAGLRGARLLSKQLRGEREPLVFLDMVNSTPEPDGTFRRYLERIDPKAYNGDAGRLCHAAMASRWFHRDEHGERVRTFERWQDYLPDAES